MKTCPKCGRGLQVLAEGRVFRLCCTGCRRAPNWCNCPPAPDWPPTPFPLVPP